MDQNSGYEKKDIPVKPVLIGGALFIITVLGTIYLLYEYYIRVLDDTTYEFKLSKRSTNLEELKKFEQDNLLYNILATLRDKVNAPTRNKKK